MQATLGHSNSTCAPCGPGVACTPEQLDRLLCIRERSARCPAKGSSWSSELSHQSDVMHVLRTWILFRSRRDTLQPDQNSAPRVRQPSTKGGGKDRLRVGHIQRRAVMTTEACRKEEAKQSHNKATRANRQQHATAQANATPVCPPFDRDLGEV